MESLEQLIAAAPDGEITENIPAERAKPSLVRVSHGWGKRYVEPITLVGDRWRETFNKAKDLVKNGGIIALYGNRGTGKTQIAAEIARDGDWPKDETEWIGGAARHSATALYRRAMDIFLDLRDCGKVNAQTSEKEVLKTLAAAGLLIIDEFQERGESEWENRVIANVIDKRYAGKRPTIIISNYSIDELNTALSPSVKDRMREHGKGFLCDWTSYRNH